MKRACFTLLEILVGLSLLLISASIVGWSLRGLVEQRRFSADMEQLKSKVFTLHHLALATETDWEARLERSGDGWVFESSCLDSQGLRPVPRLSLHPFFLFFNEQRAESFTIEFFASGAVRPQGRLQFYRDADRQGAGSREIALPELFHEVSGDGVKSLGPMHPSELRSGSPPLSS